MEVPVEIRDVARSELSRVGEIDRTERIDLLFEQHGTEQQALVHYADAGGIARGAFSGGRLVGIGVVVPHIRPAITQLASLHVSQDFRGTGVGSRLCADLELGRAPRRGHRDRRLCDAVGEHRALLPGSRLPAHGTAATGAPRAGARGHPHGKGDLSHGSMWHEGVGQFGVAPAVHRDWKAIVGAILEHTRVRHSG